MNIRRISAIEAHGKVLQEIFPRSRGLDPLELMQKLRRLEVRGHALGIRHCNGPAFKPGEYEKLENCILARVDQLLGCSKVPVFLNDDPRGYALKVDSKLTQAINDKRRKSKKQRASLHQDFGGYGIICPDFTEVR